MIAPIGRGGSGRAEHEPRGWVPSPGVSRRVFVGFPRVTQLLSDPQVNGCRGVEPSLEIRTVSKGRRGTGILDGEVTISSMWLRQSSGFALFLIKQ